MNLEKELSETGKSELYTDLNELIVKISDYIFHEEEEIRKGLGDVMEEEFWNWNLKDLRQKARPSDAQKDVQKDVQKAR